MPRGDGTGPMCGKGGSARGQGAGKGRMGGRGCGKGGECLCPKCGTRAPHEQGTPCTQQKCPQCGTAMVRA